MHRRPARRPAGGPVIALLKAAHLAALLVWCAALLALPPLLRRHPVGTGQLDFARFRRATHYGYVGVATPAAVLAIAAGTALLFLRGAFEPWFYAKLVSVGGLVVAHAWIGHLIVRTAERPRRVEAPAAWPLLLGIAAAIGATLALVLAKPVLPEALLPARLLEPLDRQLPSVAAPSP
jgi:uncharacterized membrane protein